MLADDRVALRAVPSTALLWGMAPRRRGAVNASPIVTDLANREARVPELAPTLTRSVVRSFAAAAIGVNIALSAIDVWRLHYLAVAPGAIRAALIALAVAIPLHIRHVIFGIRGERPPAGAFTLVTLAIVHVIALELVGHAWIFQFASLAVSILIVVPGAAGVGLAAAVVLSPLVLVGTQWTAVQPPEIGVYLTFALTWRSVTQYVPLRLMAAIRALDVAGRELETRAVVQARVRIDAELRAGVASALDQIVTRGDDASEIAAHDPSRAQAELEKLVHDSRRALAQARRVVAGYRHSSIRAELEAAAALLEASGASVHIAVAEGVALDSPDQNATSAIRASLARALRDEPNAFYRIEVSRDGEGSLAISLSSDDTASSSDNRKGRV